MLPPAECEGRQAQLAGSRIYRLAEAPELPKAIYDMI